MKLFSLLSGRYFYVLTFVTISFFSGCSKGGSNPTPNNPTPAPVITSLSSSEGDYGATIVITGTGFSSTISDDQVSFNGKIAAISAATTTQLTVTVPQDAGTGNVTVKVGSTTASGPVFTYLGTLSISSLSTNTGPSASSVIINGTGFSLTTANNKVFFNGVAATITSVTATQLTVSVPQNAGSGPVTITVDGFTITGPGFTSTGSLAITSLSLSEGPSSAKVTITGTGFSSVAANDLVFFNGKAAVVSAATATQLTTSVPLGAGTGSVTIKVGSTTVSGPVFTYLGVLSISSLSTNNGPANSSVTITGTGFSSTTANNLVFFNGAAATISASTATQITVNVPQNAGTGAVTITVDGVTVTGPVFTYIALKITSLNVNQGPYNTNVIITGTGFSTQAGGNRVFFNGKAAVVTNFTATQLTTSVPLGVGTGNVTVSANGATATGPVFIYQLTELVTTLAGNPSVNGSADGVGPAASFYTPAGLVIGVSGGLGVADEYNNMIRVVSPTTGQVVTVAGSLTYGLTNGTGAAARFASPNDVAEDAAGNLYVADSYNNEIRKISAGAQVSTFAGNTFTGLVNGAGSQAEFNKPTFLTVDGSGNIYVVDSGNKMIREITPAGNVSTFVTGYTLPGGARASFNGLNGIVADNSGNLYVAEAGANVIRKITPAGVVTVFAGGTQGATNGTGAGASFNAPIGLGIDGNGNIYVADSGNRLIRKITPGGVVSTFAGSTTGYLDGPAATAQFGRLYGIAVDSAGNVYVTDWNCIRKIGMQ